MSTISASTTSTTAYKVTADTTGTLVLQTGASPTTAVTIGSDQNITTSGNIRLNNGAADGANLSLASSGFSDWNIDNYSGNFRWYYNATEYMRLDASGNLGLATTSPTARLTFGLASYTSSSTNAMIRFKNDQNSADGCIQSYSVGSNIGTDVVYGSNFYVDTGGQFQRFNTSRESSFQIISRDGSVYWGTGGTGATATERARIDSSGNLLVGTTSLSLGGERMLVRTGGAGKNTAFFCFDTTDDRTAVLSFHAGSNGATSRKHFAFLNSGTSEVGSISCTGSATAYNTSSDYRLKENVQPMTGALARVGALKPVTYTWKADGSDGEGFIAHELAEVCPHAVTGEKDAVDEDGKPQHQGIDTSFLVATLTAAIQEQQQIIETLTNRITALENK